jgi:hypothetical protein
MKCDAFWQQFREHFSWGKLSECPWEPPLKLDENMMGTSKFNIFFIVMGILDWPIATMKNQALESPKLSILLSPPFDCLQEYKT